MSFQHKIFIFASTALLAGAQTLFAQKDLPTESVNVIKAFDARLLESSKINVLPTLPPLDTATQRQDYLVPQRPLTVKYDAPKLRPIGMKAGKKDENYNGFLKLGAGVPLSFWGEAGYYLAIGKQFDSKIWFRHHSLQSDNALANQKFANNDALITGNYYINDKVALEGKLGYKYDIVHFYGYKHDSLPILEDRVRQEYKILDIGLRLYNAERTDLDLNYSIAPKFYLLNDYYGDRETGFDMTLAATKWFAEKHALRFAIRTDFTNYADTVVQKLNNIYLQPSFTLHFDFLKLKLGANFASNRDQFTVYPDAELGVPVFEDQIQVFAGASGDLKKNTFRSMAAYNPFIQIRGTKLRNTSVYNYYGGLKGDLGWLEYTGQVGYSKATDLALFQTYFPGDRTTRFHVLYDTVTMLNVQGTVKVTLMKSLVLNGTLSENLSMKPKSEQEPWGLPKLEGNFGAVYTLLDGQASVKANCYIADGIWYKNADKVAQLGGVLFDLGIGGSYWFTNNIGVFLDINNILNNKRARWANYPTIGTNFLGGVTVKF
jgi:hypothetical protein